MKNIAKRTSVIMSLFFLFAFPASTHYQLKGFEFGGGGGANMGSAGYSSDVVVGEVAGEQSSAGYKANSGLAYLQQANVPGKPTLQNTASWYNKLQFIVDTSSNPTDTTYAIAISSDGFSTTQYIQDDNTVGSTLGPEDYQTYSAWGSGSGEFVIGLTPATTYEIKVKAFQGNFTETGWSPVSDAVATSDVSLTFDIDVSPTNSETGSPYQINLGDLTPGSVTTSTDKIWIDLATNAENGGYAYVYDQYQGLRSTASSHTIASSTVDLAVQSEGFGIQVDSASGGLSSVSPYNGGSENIGVVDSTVQTIFNTANIPVVAGRGSFVVKTKISNSTPAADDYADALTLIAAASF